jgi:hypothetical protein
MEGLGALSQEHGHRRASGMDPEWGDGKDNADGWSSSFDFFRARAGSGRRKGRIG